MPDSESRFVFSVQAVANTLKSVPLAVPVLENHRLDGTETLAQPVAHKDSIVACTLNTNEGRAAVHGVARRPVGETSGRWSLDSSCKPIRAASCAVNNRSMVVVLTMKLNVASQMLNRNPLRKRATFDPVPRSRFGFRITHQSTASIESARYKIKNRRICFAKA